MRRWDGLVEGYARENEARDLAQGTIAHRVRELERLGSWMKRRRPKVDLEAIDSELLLQYIKERTVFHRRGTVAGVVSDLRGMGEFLLQEGIWRQNPLRWIRGPKLDARHHLPRRIGGEELQKLWASAEQKGQEQARYQAVCVLAILYGTGLRRGELERLNVSDWDGSSGILKIDGRKTGRPRAVPVGEGVWRCIEAYLPHRHNLLEKTRRVEEQALLVNRLGERLDAFGISRLITQLCKQAGVERVTLHQFRHSCASDLIASGVRLPEVQKILGHACISSTVRYVAISAPERAKAMQRHPINSFVAGGNHVAS